MEKKQKANKQTIVRKTISLGQDDYDRLEEIVGLSTTDRIRKAIRLAHYIQYCLSAADKDGEPRIDPRIISSIF